MLKALACTALSAIMIPFASNSLHLPYQGWLLNWHEEFCQFVRSTIDSAAIELDNKYPFYGKYGRLVYTFHDKTYTAL